MESQVLAIERHWCIRKPEASAIPTQHITIYPFFSLPNHTQFSFRCPPLSHAACVSQGKLIPPQVQSGALTGMANQRIPDLWLWHGFKWACDPIQSEWIAGLLLGMLGQKCSFLDKVASGTESCFGTGYSKENQPEDKTNTEEGGIKRIAKNCWSFTSSVRGVSFFPIVVRSPPLHVGLLVALASRDRELLSCYLYTGPEEEICLDHIHVCWTSHPWGYVWPGLGAMSSLAARSRESAS